MYEHLVVGLDVGTHKICTIVGEVQPDEVYVIGVGIEPSQGMKKGVVNNIQALSEAIQASVRKAEETSGFEISSAYVSVAGSHISSITSRGVAGITDNRSVSTADIEKAMESARAIAIPHNREVLHIVPRSYTLDGHESVRSPLGMHCFRLEVDAHIITASSTSLANLEQAVKGAGLEIDRFILNPFAAGDAVLTEQEQEMGVVVIDIGGGTTDMAIFVEGTVWHTAVIPIGGELITQDITYGMNVPFELAEQMKIQRGHALVDEVNSLQTFIIQPFGEGLPQEISRRELAGIIEPRVEEILDFVKKEIKQSGYEGLLRAGAVLTGGSSQLPGIAEFASEYLGCPVRIAKPQHLTGLADSLRNPAYSTSVGLLRLGLEMESPISPDYYDNSPSAPSIRGIGDAVSRLFRRLIPDNE